VDKFEALSDPVRKKIVELLAQRDLPAGKIAEGFSVSRPAVSRHLRILRNSDLVSCRESAQQRIYRLNPTALDEIDDWLRRCRRFWNERLDALEKRLDKSVKKASAEQKDVRRSSHRNVRRS
jgi:DNA-binding transcriptional ArsR family regulator